MSNNKFQKFVKKIFFIEDEPPKKYKWRPMNDEERREYNSPDQVALRRAALEDGILICEEVKP